MDIKRKAWIAKQNRGYVKPNGGFQATLYFRRVSSDFSSLHLHQAMTWMKWLFSSSSPTIWNYSIASYTTLYELRRSKRAQTKP